MSFLDELGIITIFLVVVLVVVSVLFCAMTAMAIATAIGGTGFGWWIYAITIFCSLGGTTGGALINIRRD